jgi:antitoxin component YwqK of YwqJK toxin-antitoxin module
MFFFSKLFGRKKPNKIKIGLALGSGGAKGFAHVGALKAFEENGIEFDVIGGTSIGSIVGAFYADGYSIANYSNDKLNGEFTHYYASKKKQIVGQYLKDKKVGEWKFMDISGDVVKIQKWENGELKYDALRLNTRNNTMEIEFKDIAYFYPLGKQTCVVLKNGKKINAFNNYEQVVNLSDGNTFLLLNKTNKVYANYSAIKGTKDDGGKELLIILDPKADVEIRTDEDSRKLLQSLFRK